MAVIFLIVIQTSQDNIEASKYTLKHRKFYRQPR